MSDKVDVTINFGISNTLNKSFPRGTTFGQIVKDRNLQACLGFGDNVVAKVGGATQDANAILSDGDEVDIEVAAATKA